jgi:hypothetical protein
MLRRIVHQGSNKRRINGQARHRASMLNLHLNPSDDTGQSTQGHSQAVRAQ